MKNIEKFNVKTVKLFIPILLVLGGAAIKSSSNAYIINDDDFKKPPTSSVSSISTTYDELVTSDQLFLHFPDDQITTSNPCLTHYCAKGRECTVNDQGEPECVCQRDCPYRKKPICGTDGTVYENHCQLHRAACLLNRPIAFQKLEKCSPDMIRKKFAKHDHYKSFQVQKETTPSTTLATQISSQRPSAPPPPPPHHLTMMMMMSTTSTTETHQNPGDVLRLYDDTHQNEVQDADSGSSSSDSAYRPKGYCSSQEYEIMKDNLLLYSHTRLMVQDSNHNKDFLVSIMFSHYDQNNNGHLDEEELAKISVEEHLEDLSNGCALNDMLVFDDSNNDRSLSINEFYQAFNKLYSLSVVSLDKALETNHLSARVGDNVEIKCDVTGSPSPPIIWKRYASDLTLLSEDEVRVFNDGSLYLTKIQLINGGNYSCHAQRNKDVMQTHILTVHTLPEVRVLPRLQSRRPGENCEMFCHVTGEPFPNVEWLKNDEPLRYELRNKYEAIGNGTSLKIFNISYSDTGAYMCQATNIGGIVRDISSLIVQEEPTPTVLNEERKFFVFHEYGIAIYEPSACRLHHQIHGSDIIPGTQELVCGLQGTACSWGRTINVGAHYIYVTQPLLDRILIISTVQLVVVDVITADKYPVNLYYIPHLDHVWVLNWRSTYDTDSKTIQVIRNACVKKKHYTVHPEPIDGQFDLMKGLFLPASDIEQSHYTYKYGYVTHKNQRGVYKLDLVNLRYVKSVDLAVYNCVPENIEFSALYGFVVMSCREPVTGRPTGQLLMDYLTDTVLSAKPTLTGVPKISPDSRHVATIDHMDDGGVTLVVQKITPNGLEFVFDVRTTLNISDITFYESQTMHGYDLYATASDKEDILYLNLFSGKVEMITGVGSPMSVEQSKWNNPVRPIRSSGLFGVYMVTPANNALFVINGKSRTVNCEIGGVHRPTELVWTINRTHNYATTDEVTRGGGGGGVTGDQQDTSNASQQQQTKQHND